MSQTTISLPITQSTKKAAEKAATSYGFVSLTEAVKVFIQNLAKGKTSVEPKEKVVMLSKKAIKRYNKMSDDIASGKEKVYKANSVEEFIEQLRSA